MAGVGSTDLSLEEREEIEKLLKLDFALSRIASTIVRSFSVVKSEVKRNGGRKEYKAKDAHEAYMMRNEARKRKIRKNLTQEEIDKITSLAKEGHSLNRIYEITGVGYDRVRKYLVENNIRMKGHNYAGVEQRFSAIEMQLEIILDIMKQKGQK